MISKSKSLLLTEFDREEEHENRAEGLIFGEVREGIEMSGRWLISAIAVELQASDFFNSSLYSWKID